MRWVPVLYVIGIMVFSLPSMRSSPAGSKLVAWRPRAPLRLTFGAIFEAYLQRLKKMRRQ